MQMKGGCFMDLRVLRYFLVVAGCRSFTKAANSLHVSQPALSFAVKKLESELEARLFDRGKNGLVLNGNGRRALARATEILNGAEAVSFRRYAEDQVSVLFSAEEDFVRELRAYELLPAPMTEEER